MSRKDLSRKFDCFWPDGEPAPIPILTLQEKYIRVFDKKELSILTGALRVYIAELRKLRADYKQHVDYNGTEQISQKIDYAIDLSNQMNPVHLFDFNLLMKENSSEETSREPEEE